MRPTRRGRGFTLLEMMTASAILLVATAAAAELLLAATRLEANTQLALDASDGARLALNELSANIRRAGLGASGGVWIGAGGAPTRINAVFGLDGTTGAGGSPPTATPTQSDDLWLVVADRNAFRQPCVDPGAGAVVSAPGAGALSVTCTTSLSASLPLLATNLNSAALLTGVTLTGTTINYAESSLSGFSDAPEKGGFQVGDMVFQAQVLHYFVKVDPASGRPGLYRAVGKLVADAVGRPFSDDPAVGPVLVQWDVEDLQVAFGLDRSGRGDPEGYAFQPGLGPAFTPNLKALRLSVVATSQRPGRDPSGVPLTGAPYAPVAVENHTPAASADGLRRSLYTRRLELVNLGVASL